MLKKMSVLLFLLFSVSVYAGAGRNYTLENLNLYELNQHYDVDLENDQIWFGGHMLSILYTCMENLTTIRTKSKIRIEELDGDYFELIGFEYLYKSIYSNRAIVDGDDVLDTPVTLRVTREIDIVQNDDDFEGDYLFSKIFTIPNCQ